MTPSARWFILSAAREKPDSAELKVAPDENWRHFFIIALPQMQNKTQQIAAQILTTELWSFILNCYFIQAHQENKRKLAVKIIFRMPHNLRKYIILALLFSVIFPWTLMAEAAQQAPKNSLSYFLESEDAEQKSGIQSQSAQAPQVVKAPETINNEVQPAPEFEVAPPEPASEGRIDRFAAIEEIRAKLAAIEAQNQPQPEIRQAATTDETAAVKVDENKQELIYSETVIADSDSKAVAATEPAKTETAVSPVAEPEQIKTPAKETEQLAAATDEYVPFAGVLARMQQNKAKRTAEAQKLGVVLPSQGGDIATVSPSLSKMNQAIKDIMNR